MTTFYSTKQADVTYYPESKSAVITTKTDYLPLDIFKNIFTEISKQMKGNSIDRLIFDKRSLKIFHQPSMEWYYTEWKPTMLQTHGLKKHYKLLPEDKLFRKSVAIGRERILSGLPADSPLALLEIQYFENLEDAFAA